MSLYNRLNWHFQCDFWLWSQFTYAASFRTRRSLLETAPPCSNHFLSWRPFDCLKVNGVPKLDREGVKAEQPVQSTLSFPRYCALPLAGEFQSQQMRKTVHLKFSRISGLCFPIAVSSGKPSYTLHLVKQKQWSHHLLRRLWESKTRNEHS